MVAVACLISYSLILAIESRREEVGSSFTFFLQILVGLEKEAGKELAFTFEGLILFMAFIPVSRFEVLCIRYPLCLWSPMALDCFICLL